MSLAEALERERLAKVVRVPCSVSVVLASLNDTDRAHLESALRSGMSHASIARALKAEKHTTAPGPIARHRNGDCACEPR